VPANNSASVLKKFGAVKLPRGGVSKNSSEQLANPAKVVRATNKNFMKLYFFIL
jgi:hypothetical protein